MVQNSIIFHVCNAAAVSKEMNSFYFSCRRSAVLNDDDVLVIARSDAEIVASVRLCLEHEVYILRTMQVRNDLKGKGIGRLLLQRFQELTDELRIDRVYCISYDHLEYFYGIINFIKIDSAEAPDFLVQRVNNYRNQNPSKKFILMAR